MLPVRVCWLWLVRMGPDRLPSSVLADEFGSLGTLQTMFIIGNSTWRYGVLSVALVPARALSVVADRFGSKLP